MFAGGGNRCLWQAGFYRVVADALGIVPVCIAAASAGAAVAAALFAGRADMALSLFKRATATNRRNVRVANLFSREPMFPHAEIYRRTLLEIIDADALAKLHSGPDFHVPITRAPWWLGPRSGFAVAGLVGAIERVFDAPVHSPVASWIGYRADYATVSNCRTPEALADLVLASSCTPPFTPLLRYGGRPALDGGIVDNVPTAALRDTSGSTLVLLTRRYSRLPAHAACVYVQPSTDVPIALWDYTNPGGLQAAYDLGRRDGDGFVSR